MLRRTNGKFPPLLLGGFIIAILFLAYSYWSLSLQNSDALSQIESLASRLKIEDVKMSQQEKTISTLHEALKENKGLLDAEARRESQLKDDLNAADERMRNKEDEISTLTTNAKDLEIKLAESEDKLSEAYMEKERLTKENFIMISQKEDAESAITSRDEQILTLERDIKTLQQKLERGGAAEAKPVLSSRYVSANAADNNAPPSNSDRNPVLGYSEDNSIFRKPEPIVEEKGVLPEPLKPNEVPIISGYNPSRNEHLEAPPVNMVAAVPFNRGVPQKLVVVAPPKVGRSIWKSSSSTSAVVNEKPLPMAGFVPSDALPKGSLLQPRYHSKMLQTRSLVKQEKIPVQEPIITRKKMYSLGNNEMPLRDILLSNGVNNGRQLKTQKKLKSVSDVKYPKLPKFPQLRLNDPYQPPIVRNNYQKMVHGHLVDDDPSLDMHKYRNRADYGELKQAVDLLSLSNQNYFPRYNPPSGDYTEHQKELVDRFVGGDSDIKKVIQAPDFDNLDAAVDEGNQFGEDPLMPDQDPDGGDLVPDNEKLLQDDRVHENRVHDDLRDEQYHHVDPDNYQKDAQMLNAENTDWEKKGLDNDGGEVDTGGKGNVADDVAANDGDFAKENFIDDDTGGEGMGPLKLDKNFKNYDINGEEDNRADDERVL